MFSLLFAAVPVAIPVPAPETVVIAVPAEQTTEQKTTDQKLSGLTDPTQPMKLTKGEIFKEKVIKPKIITVQMIAYRPTGGSYAVINGQRLREGDNFDDTTIQKIEKDKVILANPARKPLVLDYATLSIKQREGTKP